MRKPHFGDSAVKALVPVVAVLCLCTPAGAEPKFKRVATQFIAALGDPKATSGTGAEAWGLWREDPGPRGVALEDYAQLKARDGTAPAGWTFDAQDWWLEEHGLMMEKPEFPLQPGQYLVTGGRKVTAVLTIHPKDQAGAQAWDLDKGAALYDVTHLPCRSARYGPANGAPDGAQSCAPSNAQTTAFPVTPGGPMPAVPGCKKHDYAVLFVIAVTERN
jgi:hypothetical protein